MKNKTITTILTILTFLCVKSYCQTQSKIVISNYGKKVPEGKYWKLETGNPLLIELSSGCLKSRTLCNAMLLSNPNIIFNISTGTIYQPDKSFAIIFKDLEKVPYTNNVTYSIIPRRIVNSDFDFGSLAYQSVDAVGEKEIMFLPGTYIYTSNCIETIQLSEYTLTKEILEKLARDRETKQKSEELKEQMESDKKRIEKIKYLIEGNDIDGEEFDSRGIVTNRKELGLSYSENFPKTMLKYFDETSKTYPEYQEYLKNRYSENFPKTMLKYFDETSETSPEYQEYLKNRYSDRDYYVYHLRFFFDKSGKLFKVLDNIKQQGQQYADYTPISDGFLQEFKNELTINNPGYFLYEGTKYPVNFYVLFRFNYSLTKNETITTLLIKKDKKGEIEIIDLLNTGQTELDNNKIKELIKKNSENANHSKGKYIIKILEVFENSEITIFDELTKKKQPYTYNGYKVELTQFNEK